MTPPFRTLSAVLFAEWSAIISPRIRWNIRQNGREIAGELPGNCLAVSGHRTGQCPGNFRRIATNQAPALPLHLPGKCRLSPRRMPITDPDSIRQAAAEFQPCHRPRYGNLQPWREVIIELRGKGASCEAIAGLLTRHGVKTSRTMVNEYVWTLPQPKINRRRKPRAAVAVIPTASLPAKPPVEPAPTREPAPLPSVPPKSSGPRIAQVRMLKPQNP
jgi:hypothetical protein